MSSALLKFIVIILAVLIFICFAFLLYGLFTKNSNTEVLTSDKITNYSLNLNNSEIIKDIKIINENNLLVIVSDDDQVNLIIYNLNKNKIISKIGR